MKKTSWFQCGRAALVFLLATQLSVGTVYAGKPGPSARNANAAATAYRKALKSSSMVAEVTRVQIASQLKSNRPIALVYGHWVVPVDLRPVLSNPAVRGAVIAGTPGITAQDLLNPNLTTGFAFIPSSLAGRFNVNVGGLMDTAALAALQRRMSGNFVLLFLAGAAAGAAAIGLGIGLGWEYAQIVAEREALADPDHDGKPNSEDDDDDGDGTKDSKDNYPNDASKQIVGGGCEGCDVNGVIFTSKNSDQMLTALSRAFRSLKRPGNEAQALSADVQIVFAGS